MPSGADVESETQMVFQMMDSSVLFDIADLPCGQPAVVADVVGDKRLAALLGERGLRKGATVEVLSSGNPLLVKVDDSRLCIRTDGQIEILVRVEGFRSPCAFAAR